MNKYTVLTLAVAMIATVSLSAADDAKPKARKALPKEVIEKYDTNKDGKLDKDERAAYKADQQKQKKDKAQ